MNKQLYPAEFVFPGHPDKLCDAIADALVERAAAVEQRSLCGVEVAIHMSTVFISGRIAGQGAADLDVGSVVREIYSSAGYDEEWSPRPGALEVKTALCAGPLNPGEAEFRTVSDDQSVVTGYAVDTPETNYLPAEHWLAATLGRRLERLRQERADLRLGPDGKVLVVCEPQGSRVEMFSASVQQAIGGNEIELNRAVREAVKAELDSVGWSTGDAFFVNGAGNFEVGGPEGDNGLSGKKLVVDAYGPRVPIGGGALSGKDFYKVDRAGALLARRLAKAVVLTGAARECRASLVVCPGDTALRVIRLEGDHGQSIDPNPWTSLIDLSLAAAGDRWARTPNLPAIARYGHFQDSTLDWETIRF
jgi:S-adenosylmethionine synthetase